MKPTRAKFLKTVLGLMGTPYIWGGRSRAGVDCWGLVAFALREASGGQLGFEAWWTDRAWQELPPVDSPAPGDLAFYGGKSPVDVEHVMVVIVPPRAAIETGVCMGAAGGDHTVTTVAEAEAKSACVKPRDSVFYRQDFRGYRSMAQFFS